MNQYPANPVENFEDTRAIAEALEAIAQRLRELPDTSIPPTHVEVDLVVTTGEDARSAVDLLGPALTGDSTARVDTDAVYIYSVRQMRGLSATVSTVEHRRKRPVIQAATASPFGTIIQVADDASTNIVAAGDLHM